MVKKSSKSTFTGIEVDGIYNRLSIEEEEWHGHHIDHYLFDQELLKSLAENDITVLHAALSSQNIQFKHKYVSISVNEEMVVGANYCIDATGYNRISKKALNLKEKIYSRSLYCWSGVCDAEAISKKERGKIRFLTQNNEWLWLAPNNSKAITWTRLTVDKRKKIPTILARKNQLMEASAHNVR